jgi:hypothetical protein
MVRSSGGAIVRGEKRPNTVLCLCLVDLCLVLVDRPRHVTAIIIVAHIEYHTGTRYDVIVFQNRLAKSSCVLRRVMIHFFVSRCDPSENWWLTA